MAQYKKILVATDLSDNSQELLKHATELAELYQAQLYLVHVIDQAPFTYMDEFSLPLDPELESDLEKQSQSLLAKIAKRLNIEEAQCHVCYGNIKTEVVQHAKKINADLILVGTHNNNLIDRMLGSQANAILHHAQCDVWVVRL